MAAAGFQIEDGEPGLTLRLTGDWTATELGRVSRRLDDELHGRPTPGGFQVPLPAGRIEGGVSFGQ